MAPNHIFDIFIPVQNLAHFVVVVFLFFADSEVDDTSCLNSRFCTSVYLPQGVEHVLIVFQQVTDVVNTFSSSELTI